MRIKPDCQNITLPTPLFDGQAISHPPAVCPVPGPCHWRHCLAQTIKLVIFFSSLQYALPTVVITWTSVSLKQNPQLSHFRKNSSGPKRKRRMCDMRETRPREKPLASRVVISFLNWNLQLFSACGWKNLQIRFPKGRKKKWVWKIGFLNKRVIPSSVDLFISTCVKNNKFHSYSACSNVFTHPTLF